MSNPKHSNWVETWFSEVRKHAHLEITKIPFSASSTWSIVDGSLEHQSGRFFQVSGIRWTNRNHHTFFQPILVQQEIGTLGFALYNHELLLQAKVEPGNVGIVQIAPTCQATASNLDCVHGGKTPMFAEWFVQKNKTYIHASLQSEQGSRFFRKFNRNVLLLANYEAPSNNNYRWLPVDAVLELFPLDFLVNTDARSVLVSSPWEALVAREPFTRFSTTFARELAASFNSPIPNNSLRKKILHLRTRGNSPSIIKLDELSNWRISDESITPINKKSFEIFQIKICVNGREVSSWDQPILSSFGEGYVELICGRIEGKLYFLFSLQFEPGLQNIVELGPSLVIEPGEDIPNITYSSRPDTVVLTEHRQSDEGGRFFKDITTYRLIDIGDVQEEIENGIWLTLAQVRELLNQGGWFTNEARSVLSTILSWL